MAVVFAVTFEDNTQAANAGVRAQLRGVVDATARAIVAQAAANTPPRVRTGALFAGFRAQQTGPLESSVTNDVPYFPYQELGTRRITGHFMLTRAADQVKADFEAAVARALGR